MPRSPSWLGWSVMAGMLLAFLVIASLQPPSAPPNRERAASRLNGRLVVGIDPSYPPFAATDSTNRLFGFDVDFANELANRLGARAEFVGIDVGSIFEALIQRKFDVIISGVPPYPEYSRELIYSQAYFNAGQTLVIPAAAAGPRTSTELRGQIAVEIGSAGELEARRLANGRSEITIQPYESLAAALAAVKEGKAPAAILDRVSALEAIRGEPALKLSGAPLTFEPYIVAARRSDGALLGEINAAIDALRRDGTLANLERKWLSQKAEG